MADRRRRRQCACGAAAPAVADFSSSLLPALRLFAAVAAVSAAFRQQTKATGGMLPQLLPLPLLLQGVEGWAAAGVRVSPPSLLPLLGRGASSFDGLRRRKRPGTPVVSLVGLRLVVGPQKQQQQQQLGTFEALHLPSDRPAASSTEQEQQRERQRQRRVVILENWTSGGAPNTTNAINTTVPFDAAWKRQQRYWQEHADRLLLLQQQQQQRRIGSEGGEEPHESENDDGGSSFYRPIQQGGRSRAPARGVDRVMFLQHDPVYTLGTGSDPAYILPTNKDGHGGSSSSNSGVIPVVRMDRGGEVTYHGPGQLVAYPVLDLRGYRQDIHWYMRALEEAVIVALRDGMGLDAAGRQNDTTGVWIDNHKVAAIGVKCRKWVTMHGLAVNVEHDSLSGFGGIVPCGLHGRKVGCVSQFAGRHVPVAEFAGHLRTAMEQVFRIRFVEVEVDDVQLPYPSPSPSVGGIDQEGV